MTTENGTVVITKQDERNALEKIRKIIKGLGENSYVGTAFDGALELAERNIADDAAYSVLEIVEKRNTLIDEFNAQKAAHEQEIKVLNAELAQYRNKYESATQALSELGKTYDDLHVAKLDQAHEISEAKQALKEAQGEIVKLKAKLYDLMTQEPPICRDCKEADNDETVRYCMICGEEL